MLKYLMQSTMLLNQDITKAYLEKYPHEFTQMMCSCAKSGYTILASLENVNGDKRDVRPEIQEWIDKYPKDYQKVVETVVAHHNERRSVNDAVNQTELLFNLYVNKPFLEKNPDFKNKVLNNVKNPLPEKSKTL